MDLGFGVLVAVVAFVAGATASVVGFGIGSLLTPLFAARFDVDLAVAAVALPHLAGGLLRGWRLRHAIDRQVLVRCGMVGNQGGLRAAGLSAFGLGPTAFVATSTVIGVAIDVARTPIYSYRAAHDLAGLWHIIALALGGVLAGTLAGERVLLGFSRQRFRVVLAGAIGLLGLWFLFGTP